MLYAQRVAAFNVQYDETNPLTMLQCGSDDIYRKGRLFVTPVKI